MGKGGVAIRTSRTRRNSLTDGTTKTYIQVIRVPSPTGSFAVPIVKGDFSGLPLATKIFIAEHASMCKPKAIYICDGSVEEAEELTEKLVNRGTLQKLDKMDNW